MIVEPFLHIIEKNYERCKTPKKYFDCSFNDLIKELRITDYQARATMTGKMFEHAFWYLMKMRFGIELTRDYAISKACMEGGGALDFGIVLCGRILCGIEAKGSALSASSRPALLRTDTMKKAIAQAYQFKRTFPEVPFYLVTNAKPKSGNSFCMLKLAEGDIIDQVFDVSNEHELQALANRLRVILK